MNSLEKIKKEEEEWRKEMDEHLKLSQEMQRHDNLIAVLMAVILCVFIYIMITL